MFKKLTLAGAAFAMGVVSLAPAPAMAQRYDRYASQGRYQDGYRQDRGYRDYRDQRGYRNYRGPNYAYRGGRECRDGDGGTIIGAIAGGLIGTSVAGRGDGALGAIIGAGAGALAGRAIDRSDRPNYCR
ncbi:glycine zipper 2TM domain-containing protein [Sphingomonas sp.]|uniref:glycine zipper 2TM domain-containing protein n=1 Tax=Sphingomonas sp. TaxID=28214 RepID=UPI002B8D7A0F|nr:glycine zipper 2TM domain-containing protein [Sphingomonas sp.]HWK36366.1 glycine zipper 2TM domain-containing protein [Sphingomonas sp.]